MMRHMMMGGFGHHGMTGGLGMWMMHRLLRRIVMFVMVGGLLVLVVTLWLRLQAARRNL
jgi:hypothetical protein